MDYQTGEVTLVRTGTSWAGSATGSYRPGAAATGDTITGELEISLGNRGYVYTLNLAAANGVAFVPDLVVQVGQRIRPTQYAGWVYEIADAGQLPAVEPAWWAAQGENPSQPLGSARAIARRYFQPIAYGPVPVEVI